MKFFEVEVLNFVFLHPEHEVEGTHSQEEPVSKIKFILVLFEPM